MNPQFWHGKRVFLTGHTGFKGSWLSLWLQHLGAHVTGYALNAPTEPSLFHEAHIANGMKSVIGDIRDLPHLQAAMQAAQPEIVLHLAAQPLVRYSYDNPVETYSTNVMGTVHLLESVRNTPGVRSVVNVTTDKCYENREWVWGYRENEPMGGYDPYSNSKGCSELVTSSYRSSFFNPADHARHGVAVASARAGNVLGGGDWAADRLVPDILRAFSTHQRVDIRKPDAIRPWQHVLEPLRGYLTLAQALYEKGPAFAEGWNFGPLDDDAQTVGWIVQTMARLWGGDAQWHLDEGPHPHEAHYLKLDISKAGALLAWKPALRLEQALDWTTHWMKDYLGGQDMRAASLRQIDQYSALAGTPSGGL